MDGSNEEQAMSGITDLRARRNLTRAHEGEMTIGEVADRYDVSLRTLRFYEDREMLRPRRDGTVRYYGPTDRVRLELILKGKRLGFSLGEIFQLINDGKTPADSAEFVEALDGGTIRGQIDTLEAKRAEIDEAIHELRQVHARMTRSPTDCSVMDALSA